MDRWQRLLGRPSRRFGVVSLALLALVAVLAVGPERQATARSACELLGPDSVQTALGVTRPSLIVGPEATQGGGCAWHSDDPACGLRNLGVTLLEGGGAGEAFARMKADTIIHLDVDGIGREAFLSLEPMPVGTAIQIAHLDVRTLSSWVRVTLSGRLGPLPAQQLERLGSDAVASFA